jgi:hypothetical protein
MALSERFFPNITMADFDNSMSQFVYILSGDGKRYQHVQDSSKPVAR